MIRFLVLCLVCFSFVYAAENLQNAWLNDYDSALLQAKQKHKRLLVIVGTQGCKWCGRLIYFTMNSSQVVKYANKHLVLVKLQQSDKDFPKRFATPVYPTSYLLDENGTIIRVLRGYKLADEYMKFLQSKDTNVY